ncbi:divalent cation tolerance protein CutA [Nonomuraea solani]|uniref:divalent cation tolerance protein CutA n=1 Tax=Nonomuraea solani TaxID=1144553 RepID=UPI000CDE9CF1
MAECVEVRVAVGNRDGAHAICRAIVERRLAAGGQVIGPIASTYWWKGQVEKAHVTPPLLHDPTSHDYLAHAVNALSTRPGAPARARQEKRLCDKTGSSSAQFDG